MGEQRTGTRSRRKLNRDQVQEILERNLKLYKDEESFVSYLVELAVYLMEYEYDWVNSGAPNPPGPTEVAPETPVAGRLERDGSEIFHAVTPDPGKPKDSGHCPHCGTEISGETVCPNCRNMTK